MSAAFIGLGALRPLAIAILWSPEEKGKENVGGKEIKMGNGESSFREVGCDGEERWP